MNKRRRKKEYKKLVSENQKTLLKYLMETTYPIEYIEYVTKDGKKLGGFYKL